MNPIVMEHQLRDWYRVPDELVANVVWSVRQVRSLQGEVERLEKRIKFLEQHVPPEIARPPQPELNYHARSKWE